MRENLIFYVVFLSQIFLLSHYYPKRILQRFNSALENYPASKYPKLYNKSPDYYEAGAKIYKIMNRIILLIGLVILISIGYFNLTENYKTESVFSFFYWMFQMLPIAMMEFSGFSYYKEMRKANKQPYRKAEIRPRRFFDFVSPLLFSTAAIVNVSCFFFIFYLDNFEFEIGSDTFVISLTLIAMNSLFAFIARFNINGQKQDPYQSSTDRNRQIRLNVRSLVIVSIAASAFIMAEKSIAIFDLLYLKPSMLSFYFQLIAWISLGSLLNNMDLEDINFDVYKEDAPTI